VSGISSPTTANTPNSMIVTAYDVYNNVKTNYTGTLVTTSTDSAATLPANYTFTGSDYGSHTFGGSLRFKTAGSQSVTVTDNSNSINATQSGIIVNAANATSLAIAGPSIMSNLACGGPFTVTATDTYGNAATLLSTSSITLGGAGFGTFYTDSNCVFNSSSISITAGSSSNTFYFKDSTLESLTLSASGSGFTTSTKALTVSGPTLVVTGPQFASPTNCSPAFAVTLIDGAKTAVLPIYNFVANVSVSGSAQIFSDSLCTTPVSSVTINAYSSTANLYVSDNSAESVTVTASSTGATSGTFTTNFTNSANTFLVAAGANHSCFALNGSVKCAGDNTYGQLGNSNYVASYTLTASTGLTSGVTDIEAGTNTTCAVVNGAAKCWGKGLSGQIGNGLMINESTPTAVNGLTSGVTQVAVGDTHACAVVNGGVKCWGSNASGELGNGTLTDSATPVTAIAPSSNVIKVALGTKFSCALFSTGSISCWGLNSSGQVGDASGTNQSSPVSIVPTGASEIAAGAGHACAVINSSVQCWGQDNNTYPVAPSLMSNFSGTVTSLYSSAGANFTCVTLNNGSMQCFGSDNGYGQFGNGSTFGTNGTTLANLNQVYGLTSGVLAAAVGSTHTCAATLNGFLCWGSGTGGDTAINQINAVNLPFFILGF
jgi:alpha-tubulin suppressor-like RCC1 family protein